MPRTSRDSKIEEEISEILRGALTEQPRDPGDPPRRAGRRAVRRPEQETRTSDDHPGTSPPMFYQIDVGRPADGHRDLSWKRLMAEYKKDAAARERGSDSALRVELFVRHAPDDHSPHARVDWPDPGDVAGAVAFARRLVEDGSARHSRVEARARRRNSRRGPISYNLAVFEAG
jgi:hypothetical protein